MAKEQVLVPDIGGAEAAEVVELLVAEGDSVEVEQGLIVLESDKASMEIPSTVAGTLRELLVKEGDQLAEGAPIAWIETAGGGEEEADADASAGNADAAAGAGQQAAAGGEDDSGETVAQADTDGSKERSVPGSAGAGEDTDSEEQAGGASGGAVDVPVPDIGTEDPVDLVEVCVAVGDQVAEGDSLVVLESDKASMEVPSPAAGEVLDLLVEAGQTVSEGDLLLRLSAADGAASPGGDRPGAEEQETGPASAAREHEPPASGKEESTGDTGSEATAAPDAAQTAPQSLPASTVGAPARGVYAGPAVRKLAREFGVNLNEVSGSGPRGRLLKEDLQEFVSKSLKEGPGPAAGAGVPPVPEVDFSQWGPVDVQARSKMDKLTAANMQRSWLNVPHVTQFDDIDITDLEAFRRSLKDEAAARETRLTPMPFLLKACASALRQHPKFNASLTDGGRSLAFKDYVHLGMAVDTPAGLMVPVLRDVDRKSLWELAGEVLELAGRARERKLKPAEMQGGCFTVSSLGGIGGRGFTPIINTPEVGILGVGRAAPQPVWDGAAFQPRTLLPVGLSYDHRVINGGDAGRFLETLGALLGDLRRLLL